MFLPQGQEQDSFDINGQQTDDINSLTEWADIFLGYDKTADDEDDDSGNNFLLVKTCNLINDQQYQVIFQPHLYAIREKPKFSPLQEDAFPETIIEVITPPPNPEV